METDAMPAPDQGAQPVIVASFNAVFQGGGAKGIAYGGALAAVEARGAWLRAVAGSSAGAITAALVASGLRSSEIEHLTDDAFRAFRRCLLTLVLPFKGGMISPEPLRRWLAETLAARVQGADRKLGPTFAELHAAHGIELHVVANDIATRLPCAFSSVSTPDLRVASAVVASCAIPAVFPPQRLVVVDGDDAIGIHRVVDGGTFQNLPYFVFTDEHYRAPDDLTTLAFTFAENGRPRTPERPVAFLHPRDRISSRFDGGGLETSGGSAAFLAGQFCRPILGRLLALPALALIVVAVLTAGGRLPVAAASIAARTPLSGSASSLLVASAYMGALLVLALSALIVLFAGTIGRVAAGLSSTMLRSAARPPPWARSPAGGHPKLRIVDVRASNLRTLDFFAGARKRANAKVEAYESVLTALGGTAPIGDISTVPARRTPSSNQPQRQRQLPPGFGESIVVYLLTIAFVLVAIQPLYLAPLVLLLYAASFWTRWSWALLVAGPVLLALGLVGVVREGMSVSGAGHSHLWSLAYAAAGAVLLARRSSVSYRKLRLSIPGYSRGQPVGDVQSDGLLHPVVAIATASAVLALSAVGMVAADRLLTSRLADVHWEFGPGGVTWEVTRVESAGGSTDVQVFGLPRGPSDETAGNLADLNTAATARAREALEGAGLSPIEVEARLMVRTALFGEWVKATPEGDIALEVSPGFAQRLRVGDLLPPSVVRGVGVAGTMELLLIEELGQPPDSPTTSDSLGALANLMLSETAYSDLASFGYLVGTAVLLALTIGCLEIIQRQQFRRRLLYAMNRPSELGRALATPPAQTSHV